MSTVHQQHQCSYAAVLNLSDKVSVCREFRTSTALPFLILPSQITGDTYSSKAFTNFFWKLHPFYRRGLICLSEGPQQKHELPHSDASLRRVMTTVHTERTAAKAVLLSCRSAPTAQNQSSEDALSSRQLEKSQACKTVWFCLFCLVSCLTWIKCQ